MVWVRRVRTASGATAVQIVESVQGRRRIVRHVGSAHDEVTLAMLLEEADGLIVDDAQLLLDLGVGVHGPSRRAAARGDFTRTSVRPSSAPRPAGASPTGDPLLLRAAL